VPRTRAPSPAEFAAQYRACRARTTALLARVDDETARTVMVPACPEWSVHSLACHLAGVAAALVARDNPSGDQQAWVDRLVDERRDAPLATVIDEWNGAGPAFEAVIERYPHHFAGLVYDVVAHEHDLRAALGADGEPDLEGVRVAMSLAITLLEADLARHRLPAVRLVAGDDEWVAGEGTPELELDTDLFELFRLLGSRRSRAQVLAAPWNGDVERFLPALAHMPLPPDDLRG
jgi:uncharacterized protein (TIGR03083 family)